MVHAYVISRMDQNNSLLLGLPNTRISRIQMVQNASARMITGARKIEHITPILANLHWLPIQKRIIFKVLLLIFKCHVLHQGPDYLKELLIPYTPLRDLRSVSQNLLVIPHANHCETQRRDFSIRGPTEWNRLPLHIRNSKTLQSFKKSLKTHLFTISYL